MRLAGSMVLLLAALAALVGCEELLRPGFPHEAHLLAKAFRVESPTLAVCGVVKRTAKCGQADFHRECRLQMMPRDAFMQ